MDLHLKSSALVAEQLLELAQRSGAIAAEVLQAQSLSHPVFFEANRLKQLESAQSEGTALRVWVRGRPGLAVAYGPVEPQALVDRAIALSALNEPEAIDLNGATNVVYPNLGTAVTVEQLVDWGKQAIALIRDVYPEILCTAEWDCEAETTRLINSQGLDCSYTDTTLSSFMTTEWIRGDDFLSVSDGQVQRDNLSPQALVEPILQRLAWAQNNANPSLGRVPVLLTAKAADLLWGTIQSALNGKRVVEGASPWSESLGQQVVAETITLCQQPQIGPFSCPFDDEGTPTRSLTLIDAGRLQLFYSDRKTGKALGQESTGNGFRPELGSYPTPGLCNVILQPGDRSLKALIRSLDNGLVIDQALGGGAGLSGDFSVNVELGYQVQQGQVIGRVKDTMLSGNVYTALKQLVDLGNDRAWNGACYTPSLVVEGLSVTASD